MECYLDLVVLALRAEQDVAVGRLENGDERLEQRLLLIVLYGESSSGKPLGTHIFVRLLFEFRNELFLIPQAQVVPEKFFALFIIIKVLDKNMLFEICAFGIFM